MRGERDMTRAEVIASLEDQARDKESLAGRSRTAFSPGTRRPCGRRLRCCGERPQMKEE